MDIRSCSRPGYSPGLLIFNSILQILYDVKQLGWTLDFYWNFGGKKVRPILEYTIVQQCINNIYLFSISVKRKILPQCYITQKIIKVKKKKKYALYLRKISRHLVALTLMTLWSIGQRFLFVNLIILKRKQHKKILKTTSTLNERIKISLSKESGSMIAWLTEITMIIFIVTDIHSNNAMLSFWTNTVLIIANNETIWTVSNWRRMNL